MPVRSTHPRLLAGAAALLILLVAGCAGAAAPSAAPTTAAPSNDPGQAIDVDTLLADATARDGQSVRVTGNFLADETTAQLCAVLMESYPPQCGGGVRLTGEVPADTLAALTTTTEPNLKKMWWGYVTLTGTFRATSDDGKPAIEITDFVLVEG